MSTTMTIVGNLAADPELKFTASGKAIATFTVLSSRSRKNEETGQWESFDTTGWKVTAWERLGENVAESLSKGDGVVVVGTAVWRSWEKDDGSKGGRIEVTATNIGVDLKRGIAKVTRVQRAESTTANARTVTGDFEEMPF